MCLQWLWDQCFAKMHRKGLRDKCFAIAIHVPDMLLEIVVVSLRAVPYVNLFPWLTDFGMMYAAIVIVTEFVFLLVHIFECVQIYRNNDTTKRGGCLCNCRNNCSAERCNVWILGVLVGGLVLQSIFFCLSCTYVYRIRDMVDDDLYEWVTKFYGLPDRESITETINDLQRHEECCGVFDYHDYNNSAYANLTTYGGRVVPLTCFRIPEEGMKETGQEIDESKIYDKGCFEALIDVYNGSFRVVWNYIIISTVNLIDIFRVLCNMILAKQINREGEYIVKPKKMKTVGQGESTPLLMSIHASEPEGGIEFEGQDKNRTTTQKSKSTSSNGPSPSTPERQMPQVTSFHEERGHSLA